MTNRSSALAHYRNAIRALSTDTYDGLSPQERTELLHTLRDEQYRLLHQIVADWSDRTAVAPDPVPSTSLEDRPPTPPC